MLVDCRSLMRNWRWKTERRMFWSRMEDAGFTIRFSAFLLHHFKRSKSGLEGPAETWFQNHARNHRRLGMISSSDDGIALWRFDVKEKLSKSREAQEDEAGSIFWECLCGLGLCIKKKIKKKYTADSSINCFLTCLLLRSLTAERVATLLAQLKEKQELRSIKSICCCEMFKGSQRNCTVLVAPLDHRQNCKSCNALLLRLESKMSFLVMNACISPERSHQSLILEFYKIVFFDCLVFISYIYIYIALLLSSTLQSSYEANWTSAMPCACSDWTYLDMDRLESQEMWEADLNAILVEPEAQHGTACSFQLLLVWMLGLLLYYSTLLP